MQMHMFGKSSRNDNLSNHTPIINKLEESIKFYNWDFILPFLPEGSFLVGGYIRDIILGRLSQRDDIDIDIVVPLNAINIGRQISREYSCKFLILDKKRQIVRIIFNNISVDIANQITSSIEGDLKSRDFSINSIAYSFNKKSLIDPLNGIKDIELNCIRSFKEENLFKDPLRMLRCFRFVSELNFYIHIKLMIQIKKLKSKLNLVSKERINYEIQRIAKGKNACESIVLMQKINIFGFKNKYKDSFFLNLRKINYDVLNLSEKEKFLPLFFKSQILNEISFEEFKFSKTEISKSRLLRKWNYILRKRNILELDELERFKLHQELEDILPSFIFFLPNHLQTEWLNRWRDKDDKLFHPSNLIDGNVIKKHLNIDDGPFLGKLLAYLSMEFAYERLHDFDEAIYKAKYWIEQNAPKCD